MLRAVSRQLPRARSKLPARAAPRGAVGVLVPKSIPFAGQWPPPQLCAVLGAHSCRDSGRGCSLSELTPGAHGTRLKLSPSMSWLSHLPGPAPTTPLSLPLPALLSVLVGQSCCHRHHWRGSLSSVCSLTVWRPDVCDGDAGRLGRSEASLLGLQTAVHGCVPSWLLFWAPSALDTPLCVLTPFPTRTPASLMASF